MRSISRYSVGVMALLLCMSCSPCHIRHEDGGTAARTLQQLVDSNPEVKRLLVASIEQGRRINPDPLTNPAQTLDQYYDFVAFVERAIPGSLIKPKPDATLYQRIDQSLCYLFFISDIPLEELKGRGYFNNSLQYVEPYNVWMHTFVKAWGAFLDTPESWNGEYLRLAQADDSFGLKQGWYEAPSNWKTFNQFFTRHLASDDSRPIASPGDDAVFASPVDAVPQGLWAIDGQSRLIAQPGVPVKSATVQAIEDLLGAQSPYRRAFAGGTFTHLFLDVGDYHHYHFPLSGVVKEVRILPGQELAGGYVTWDAVDKRYAFDPSSVGWQSLETRGLVILETEKFGLVALLPIGMSPVSSVNFLPSLKEGTVVRKGDPMGYFLFGGSDFIVVLQAGVEFTLETPNLGPDKGYPRVLMGQRLGQLRPRSRSAARPLARSDTQG